MATLDTFTFGHLPIATTVLAAAYLIRGITGFGSGLVAIPLLALILPLPVVVPVIALLDFLASITHGISSRRIVQWREIATLLPFSLLGILLSIYIFKTVDPDALRQALAIFVIAYALYSLRADTTPRKVSWLWAIPWGGLGGIVNSLFGTGGPFYVIYLKLRSLGMAELRATIAMILLLDGIGRLAGYSAAGFFNSTALTLVAAGIPLGGLALYVGGTIHTNLDTKVFQTAINVLLLTSGLALLVQ